MPASPRVWFITGTSKGFGRVWAQAALERGDKVAATARDAGSLEDLVERHGENVLAIELDVTDTAAVEAAVKQAHEHFGRLDVVINNAGYGLFGTIEEVTEEQARAQIETNLFGALWVTKAVLPYLREQGSGHIIQVSSIGGVQAFPTVGLYHASKWGLEGFTQALDAEVREMGIHVTLVEPRWLRDRLGRILGGARRAASRLRAAMGETRKDVRLCQQQPWRARGDGTGDPAGRRRR